ncbi:hypothetical protein QN277_005831 [Acacia crassicarpa]|uniref:F-box domain-containing protein n=1 Tax=Acacia crassicarpa TaxID=499986 RepID=A0AAE1MA56_9FABA|nr:hypothetical protein QN277_005831 [Acacia crassicarpa]
MKPQLVAGNQPYLAEEIITDILKLLPVKSLIRFQSVCKPWENLIKSALFITEHLHYSTHQNSCLLLKYGNFSSQTLHLRLLDWEMQIHEILHSRTFTRLIGSINGLLCLYPFVLWNPATREVRQLPLPRKQHDPCRSTTGFGYSPVVNDYKIVRIYSNFEPDGYTLTGAEVYSLSTDSWKDVDLGVLQGVELDLYLVNNVSANGSIFWRGLNSDAIVSYDIATEVFTLIPISTIPLSTILTVYDDKLALVSIKNKWIELWVLQKGIDSSSETWSWIKKHTERCPSDSLLWYTIWRNHLTFYGHYLPIHDLALYLFKIPTNEMKVGLIPEVDGDQPHYVFNYAESLVPLRQHPH